MAAVEHHLEVARTARYWTLGEEAPEPREVWFVLHGFKQLAGRFLGRFEVLDDGTRLIVAPEALSRFYVGGETGRHGPGSLVGATWMTREERVHEIRDYVAYLDRLAGEVLVGARRSARVVVLGFSQGVATAARWTTLGKMRPRRLILWAELLPPDLDGERAARAWTDTDVVLVRGDADGALADASLVAAERARVEAAGIRVRVHPYAGGHAIPTDVLLDVAAEDPPRGGT
jgi:predicted esterase